MSVTYTIERALLEEVTEEALAKSPRFTPAERETIRGTVRTLREFVRGSFLAGPGCPLRQAFPDTWDRYSGPGYNFATVLDARLGAVGYPSREVIEVTS